MRRISKIFTIPERDCESAKRLLEKSALSEKEKNELLAFIADHELVVKFRKRVIELQHSTADGIFSIEADLPNVASERALACEEFRDAPSDNDIDEDDAVEIDSPSAAEEFVENSPEKQKRGKKALPKGTHQHHALKDDEKICTNCHGKMVMARTKKKTTVLCQPTITTRTDEMETCHCERCNVTVSAEMPLAAQQTIGRYHYSAVANFAALRYLYGMASYRLEEYCSHVGLRVSDSTQWHLFEEAASLLYKFVEFLKREAANAPTCHIDDTHQLILEIAREVERTQDEARRNGKKIEDIRSGIHTTNLTAVFPQGEIVLYQSGLHHAGEAFAQLLSKRSIEDQIVLMADASTSNTSNLKNSKNKVEVANCNAHAVRKFKELKEAEDKIAKEFYISDHKVSEQIGFFLRGYKRIFDNEKRAEALSPPDRLKFHERESLPIMESMRVRIEKNLANKQVEPNSDVGKVYSYLINHWQELAAFCLVEGAPVCNNLSERMLKGAIRHRKNSLFFKNQLGAKVGDIFTSILMTAKANDISPIEYLQNLLVYRNQWSDSPSDWLPWNYTTTIAKLNQSAR